MHPNPEASLQPSGQDTSPLSRQGEILNNGISRREFVGRSGGGALMGCVMSLAAANNRSSEAAAPEAKPLPAGSPLRVKPVLTYHLDRPAERTSWRSYGGLQTQNDVRREQDRIASELRDLGSRSDFPIELRPLAVVGNDAEAEAVCANKECDALLVYAASGSQRWLEKMAACGRPNVMFVRHKSGPLYLWYEIAHWRFLRKSEDAMAEPNMDVDDIVVDDYDDVLWRLRALYGLKNAKGTKMLAVGGLAAYSAPGQQLGPTHAREIWGFDHATVSHEDIQKRLQQARANTEVMDLVNRQADELIAQPGVTLKTDRKFVVNSFLAVRVFKELMRETGAANLGVGQCMGSLIAVLDTPPCLALSLLNDEGATAFCHSDFTHTTAGVLLRWISGKPSFVCNSHFPHHDVVTLAHCAAPRRMNGRTCEPTAIMTHFESDYGAATKVSYPKGQQVTCLIPNLRCTKWHGFRAQIVDSPSFDMCRSQMDVRIEGDWRRLLREMEGFHMVVCYGDYLREVGYALKKVGKLEWINVSYS